MAKMEMHKEERDRIKAIIEEYQCSPFDGQCYTQEVTFYRDKRTGLFHIILSPSSVAKYQLFEDDYINEELKRNSRTGETMVTMSMIMIKPTKSDNNYIFFRRK